MNINARSIYQTESHSVDVWTVPCRLLGGRWNRIWVAIRTPNWSAAYPADQIEGTNTSDFEHEHISTLIRLGTLPSDAAIRNK